jgi:hypothetical protein
VGQARYALTSNVTLLGEYTHMRSESQGGLRGRWAVSRDIGTSDSFALGSIAFF